MDAKPWLETRHYLRTRNKFENGGMLMVMDSLDKFASDYNDIMAIGRRFAELGNIVHVLGIIHFKNPDYSKYFGPLIGTDYYKKCPDLKIEGKLYEYEGFIGTWSKRKLSRMLSHGAKQSPYLIIKNTRGCSDRFILKCIHDRVKDSSFNHSILEVWVYEKGNVRLVYKKR